MYAMCSVGEKTTHIVLKIAEAFVECNISRVGQNSGTFSIIYFIVYKFINTINHSPIIDIEGNPTMYQYRLSLLLR